VSADRVTWVGHATVLIELGGVRLHTDPLLRGQLGHLRRHGPAPAAGTMEHLDALRRIAAGDLAAGAIAALPASERFHWLVAPSSTIIQCSPVHTGLTDDPEAELERLLAQLVR
jgi:hypothetical protein